MRARGRPILGALGGLLLGISLSLLLLTTGRVALDSKLLVILPPVLFVLGIVWAFTAPLGPRKPPPGWRPKTPPDSST